LEGKFIKVGDDVVAYRRRDVDVEVGVFAQTDMLWSKGGPDNYDNPVMRDKMKPPGGCRCAV
jgi:hypothetical protein